MDSSGLDYFLPTAVGCGLPIIAAKNDETCEVIPADQNANVNWFTADSTGASFRAAMRSAMEDLPGHRKRALLLAKEMLQTRSYQRTIDDYTQLIDDTIAQRPGQQRPDGAARAPANTTSANTTNRRRETRRERPGNETTEDRPDHPDDGSWRCGKAIVVVGDESAA